MKVQYNIRLEESLIKEIIDMAAAETKRTGYKITATEFVRKALTQYMGGLKK